MTAYDDRLDAALQDFYQSDAAREYEAAVDQAIGLLSRQALAGGPALRGVCAVCGAPVTDDDAPVAVEWADGRPGVLHGSYDCLDQERCPTTGSLSSEVYPDQPTEVRCLLVVNHPVDRHLFG